MKAATNQGDFLFETKRGLVEFIRRRSEEFPMDEIWIDGEQPYPCMALLTNGEYASIDYFLNETGDMWLSQGDLDIEIPFLAAGAEWISPTDAVIWFEDAIKCVEEFCDTLSRPTCIAWQEL